MRIDEIDAQVDALDREEEELAAWLEDYDPVEMALIQGYCGEALEWRIEDGLRRVRDAEDRLLHIARERYGLLRWKQRALQRNYERRPFPALDG